MTTDNNTQHSVPTTEIDSERTFPFTNIVLPINPQAWRDSCDARLNEDWPANYYGGEREDAWDAQNWDHYPLLLGEGGLLANYSRSIWTGRYQAVAPPVQNIPSPLRAAIQSPGRLIISADYVGLHPRLLGEFSGDETLKASCEAGDPYLALTNKLAEDCGITLEGDRARKAAKQMTNALINGGGTPVIEEKLVEYEANDAVSAVELKDFIWGQWPEAVRFLASTAEEAESSGWNLRLPYGRVIQFPEDKRQHRLVACALLQGHEADVVSMSLVDIYAQKRARGCPSLELILHLHDGIMLSVVPDEALAARDLIIEVMEHNLIPGQHVPGTVDVTIGTNGSKDSQQPFRDDTLPPLETPAEYLTQRSQFRLQAKRDLRAMKTSTAAVEAAVNADYTRMLALEILHMDSPEDVRRGLGAVARAPGGRDAARSFKAALRDATEVYTWAKTVLGSTTAEGAALQEVYKNTDKDKNGRTKATHKTLVAILENDPEYVGLLWKNEFNHKLYSGREYLTDDTIKELKRSIGRKYHIENMNIETLNGAADEVALTNKRDPLVDMLDACERAYLLNRNKQSLLDTWITTVFPELEDNELHRAYGRRMILGMVARAYVPGIKFDYVPILVGEQGARKSTFGRILAGKTDDGSNLFVDTSIDLTRKGLLEEAIQGVWLMEMAEFDKHSAKGQADIKAVITQQEDVYRFPYDRRVSILPRRTIFFGTTNNREILTDPTGSRRFWVMDIGSTTRLQWLTDNREQLMGEAAAFFKANREDITNINSDNYHLYLPPHLEEAREEANDTQFTVEDPIADKILELASKHRIDREGFSVLDVIEALELRVNDKTSKYVLPRLLKQLGCVKQDKRTSVRGRRIYLWSFPENSPHFTNTTTHPLKARMLRVLPSVDTSAEAAEEIQTEGLAD